MANYIKGNLLNIFYAVSETGIDSSIASTSWKFFAYTQSSGLSISNSLTNISSKSHGEHPDKILQESTATLSSTAYGTIEDLNNAVQMAQDGKEYSFCFCKVAEDDTVANTGLNSVTGVGSVSAFTPGTQFVKYANGIVSSASISSQTGDMSSIDIEITTLGALSDTAPTGDRLKPFVKA